VSCIVEELIGCVKVAAPPLGKDSPTPPVAEDKVMEVRSAVCSLLMEASMVVCEPRRMSSHHSL
jgi:hypothetical protein